MNKNTAVPHATERYAASKGKQHLAHSFRTLLFLLAAGMFLFSCKDDGPKPSSDASIIFLTLTVEDIDYAITFTGKEGKITLPYATELPVTATVKAVVLAAKAKGVKVGDSVTLPVSGTVTFTVTAEDDKTKGVYTLTVENAPASKEASITSLTLTVDGVDYPVIFTREQGRITLPFGTEIPTTTTVKEVGLSAKATGIKVGDTITISISGTGTVTVTAQDGETTQEYTVTLVVSQTAAPLFTSFTFEVTANENMALDAADRQRIEGEINQQDNTITFPDQSAYVYLNRLKAAFTTSAGATVQVEGADQVSGVTEQDFSSPVSYVVRTADGTETTYTVTLTKSTMATIPDAQFRARLQQFFPAAFTEDQLDITHDVLVNNDVELVLRNQTPKLTSLKGVEFFTTLTYLSCSTNSLKSLDVSKNTALTNLSCSDNSIPSLDVSKNTALTELYCRENALLSLDVSANTSLTNLSCSDNSIPSLDVSKNTALMVLECFNNDLTSLDVRKNTALTTLNCSRIGATSLDVSKNTALNSLYCATNSLSSLDVSANTSLRGLYCDNNALDSLDVSKNTSLRTLYCNKNKLTFLNMTGMRSIGNLDIGTGTGADNPLETLRVNTVVQDNDAIITMKTARGAALTVTTVNDAGTEVCTDYTPAEGGGTCN